MNKDRRAQIAALAKQIQEEIGSKIDSLVTSIESIKDEEEEYFSNMPESLQQSERGQAAEAAVEALDSAAESLRSAEESIAECISSMEDAGGG